MTYLGSKRRFLSYLLPVLLGARKSGQTWVEPFVGGANVISAVSGERLGNDQHPQLIALLQAIQQGWQPPEWVTKETYYRIKADPEAFPPQLVGFVGFLCSFGCKWWGGYASNSRGSNYAAQGRRGLLKQAPSLSGVTLLCGDYQDMAIPKDSLVYCDPPYKGTTGYSQKLDHSIFWLWCQQLANKGNSVFVSEYDAPAWAEPVLTLATRTVLNRNSSSSRIERLFRVHPQV